MSGCVLASTVAVLAVPGSVARDSVPVLSVGAVSLGSSTVVPNVSYSETVSVLSLSVFNVVSVFSAVGVSVVRTTGRIV